MISLIAIGYEKMDLTKPTQSIGDILVLFFYGFATLNCFINIEGTVIHVCFIISLNEIQQLSPYN